MVTTLFQVSPFSMLSFISRTYLIVLRKQFGSGFQSRFQVIVESKQTTFPWHSNSISQHGITPLPLKMDILVSQGSRKCKIRGGSRCTRHMEILFPRLEYASSAMQATKTYRRTKRRPPQHTKILHIQRITNMKSR